MPNVIAYLNQTPDFEWYALGVALRTDARKRCV